jgi:DNA-binding NarL/FixJ family response regulator
MQTTAQDAIATHEHLTPRECDVVRAIIAGRTNREMAMDFGLTEQSVKNVLSTVYQKCQVRNRLQLAMLAVRHRLAFN